VLRLIDDASNPTAAEVINLETDQKKTVAIQDIKPYHNRIETDPASGAVQLDGDESGGSDDQDADPGLYVSAEGISGPQIADVDPEPIASTLEEVGDIHRPDGPPASTPKRVRISDSVTHHSFAPDSPSCIPQSPTLRTPQIAESHSEREGSGSAGDILKTNDQVRPSTSTQIAHRTEMVSRPSRLPRLTSLSTRSPSRKSEQFSSSDEILRTD